MGNFKSGIGDSLGARQQLVEKAFEEADVDLLLPLLQASPQTSGDSLTVIQIIQIILYGSSYSTVWSSRLGQ